MKRKLPALAFILVSYLTSYYPVRADLIGNVPTPDVTLPVALIISTLCACTSIIVLLIVIIVKVKKANDKK